MVVDELTDGSTPDLFTTKVEDVSLRNLTLFSSRST